MRNCTVHATRGQDKAASTSYLVQHQDGGGYVAHACLECASAYAAMRGARRLRTFDPVIGALPPGTAIAKPMGAAEFKRVADELEKRNLFGSGL